MTFNRNNFYLQSKVAEDLYRLVENSQLKTSTVTYHLKKIFEDKPFRECCTSMARGDHYKWRLMRANGVSERLITGMQLLKKNLKLGQNVG